MDQAVYVPLIGICVQAVYVPGDIYQIYHIYIYQYTALHIPPIHMGPSAVYVSCLSAMHSTRITEGFMATQGARFFPKQERRPRVLDNIAPRNPADGSQRLQTRMLHFSMERAEIHLLTFR